MSRYEILHTSLTIVTGWDCGLQTFFGRVTDDARPEGEEELLWVGCTPREVRTVVDLGILLAPYYALDAETCAQLLQDRDLQPPLTPLQRDMLAFLETVNAEAQARRKHLRQEGD